MNSIALYCILLCMLCLGKCSKNSNAIINNTVKSGVDLSSSQYTDNILALKRAYPRQISDFKDNYLIMANGTKLLYDDGITRDQEELLEDPDIKDMFHYKYDRTVVEPIFGYDPGRIRNQELFESMYGASASKVESHLVKVRWCPQLTGQILLFTSINGASEALQAVSEEIDTMHELKPFVNGASTFNWRKIAGTNRLSTHSFGIAIDICVAKSDYWRWNNKNAGELDTINYKNKIPVKIVEIFERHGFIWGGRWYHYDTMHFEYRPELLTAQSN